MKIAMIFDGLGFGGIERVGVDYIKLLAELGHEITVFNLNPNQTDMELELEKNVTVYHQSFPRNICPCRYYALRKKGLIGRCMFIPVYGVASAICKGRYIINREKTLMFDIGIAFSGHYNDLTFLTDNFVRVKKKVAWVHGGIVGYAALSKGFLELYAKIKNIVTLSSENEQKILKENPFLNDVKTQKIYNPSFIGQKAVDSDVVRELTEKYGEFILMIGRFTFEKDHRMVVDAMEILNKEYQMSYKLLFVGDGENKKEIEEYVKHKHLEEQIIFIGKRYDVQNFYQAAKLYVHASPAEGLPTVLIEAMKFGVPIVTTNSKPGVPEVLENGHDGIVCKVGDSKGLADGMHQLLSDDVLYQNYVQLEKERSNAFEPETIRDQLEQYLTSLK